MARLRRHPDDALLEKLGNALTTGGVSAVLAEFNSAIAAEIEGHKRAKAHMENKAYMLADLSLGKTMQVSEDNATYSGVITSCVPLPLKENARSWSASWKITMLCGSHKVERTFVVTKLPK